jgi:hypothetical protein
MKARDILGQAIRVPRILWAALTASQGLLLVVLFVQRNHLDPSHALPSLSVLMIGVGAVGCAVASVLVPARSYAQAARARPMEISRPEAGGYRPTPRFADPVTAARRAAALGTTALILKMALAEAVSLNGFTLGFLGSPPSTFLPFFGVGLLLAVVRFPTVESFMRPFELVYGASFDAEDPPTTL